MAVHSNRLGPARALRPEDRSNDETNIPNYVEIKSIKPRSNLEVVIQKMKFMLNYDTQFVNKSNIWKHYAQSPYQRYPY